MYLPTPTVCRLYDHSVKCERKDLYRCPEGISRTKDTSAKNMGPKISYSLVGWGGGATLTSRRCHTRRWLLSQASGGKAANTLFLWASGTPAPPRLLKEQALGRAGAPVSKYGPLLRPDLEATKAKFDVLKIALLKSKSKLHTEHRLGLLLLVRSKLGLSTVKKYIDALINGAVGLAKKLLGIMGIVTK
jgi:hypothetical protein